MMTSKRAPGVAPDPRAEPRTSSVRLRRVLGVVIAVAIVLRLIVAVMLGDQAVPVSGAADQYSYDVLAQSVVAGRGFSFPSPWYPFTQATEPTAHWSYLYTLYLAGVYALLGHHPLAARLIQVALSGLSCWLTYRLGRQLFDHRVGLAAAVLTAGYAYFVFFSAALMTQTFYIIALLAALLCAGDLAQRSTRRAWVLLGLSLGVGALLRQTLLLFSPILVGWIAWTTRERLRWRDPLIAAGIIALLVAPWTVYNYRTFGDFLLLNSNGGFWLYSSNHPNQGTHFNPNYVAPIPVQLQGLSEPALDRALYREAIRFIVADPARFMLLSLNRIPHYFWLFPSEQSSALSNVARLSSFTLYLPFMLYGLYLSRSCWRRCLPLYLYGGFDAILHLTSWAAPRYRLPSDALMMVFAGLAVVQLVGRLRARAIRAPTPTSASQYRPRS